jgi:hypothetical protein
MKEVDPDIAALLARARKIRQEAIALRPQIQNALADWDLAEYFALCARVSELRAQSRTLVDQAVDLARARYTLHGPTTL